MFASLLILLALPILDTSRIKGNGFRPLSKALFWGFVGNFSVLMYLGQCHVEDPFTAFSQICTFIYFCYFLLLVPIVGIIENTLFDLTNDSHFTGLTPLKRGFDPVILYSNLVNKYNKFKERREWKDFLVGFNKFRLPPVFTKIHSYKMVQFYIITSIFLIIIVRLAKLFNFDILAKLVLNGHRYIALTIVLISLSFNLYIMVLGLIKLYMGYKNIKDRKIKQSYV